VHLAFNVKALRQEAGRLWPAIRFARSDYDSSIGWCGTANTHLIGLGWLLRSIYQLRQAQLPQLVTLGDTLHSWSEEIATMWRFTKNNGITEGFHTKMELISRQAYGFRNFDNYRSRVKVLCG
jgi:hypothetical protein